MRRFPALLVILALAVTALASCPSTPAGPPPSPQALIGRWSGSVTAEGLATIAIIVVFDEHLQGIMDVPAQGKTGVALTGIDIAPPRVYFELPIDDGKAVFEGVLRGDTISGSFIQGPLTATFSIHRSAAP
jgi:hypothetical protein